MENKIVIIDFALINEADTEDYFNENTPITYDNVAYEDICDRVILVNGKEVYHNDNWHSHPDIALKASIATAKAISNNVKLYQGVFVFNEDNDRDYFFSTSLKKISEIYFKKTNSSDEDLLHEADISDEDY